MTVTKSLLSGVFLACALGFPVSATSLASVSASVGATTCSQANPNSATCNVSVPVGSQTASASAVATATWALNGSGTLEATAQGFGSNTIGVANVSFSNPLIVTGVTGSGTLQIVFSGFHMNILNIPGGASVSPVLVSLGGSSTSTVLPNGSPQTFSVTAPITFNSATPFSVAFAANATGTFFNNGTFAMNDADGLLQFPTFVVTDSSGNVLRGASVQFVPEPATWFSVVLGLTALLLIQRVRKQLA